MDDLRTKTQMCHIDKLHDDIFYKIFYGLASDFTAIYACLLYTLANSQVCRKWRRILLDAPAIWGHVACIMVPARREFISAYMFSTILSRSGEAPLWIYGETNWLDSEPEVRLLRHAAAANAMRPLLSHLLQCNAQRVERMSLDLAGLAVEILPAESVESLLLQGVHMRHFDVSLGWPTHSTECNAVPVELPPVLNYFNLKSMRYKLLPSRKSALRSLTLHGHVVGCTTINDTLRLLASMPLLEHCSLEHFIEDDLKTPSIHLQLPMLSDLHIKSTLPIFQALTSQCIANCSCSVTFDINVNFQEPDNSACSVLVGNVFLPFLTNNITIHRSRTDNKPIEEVRLVFTDHLFSVSWPSLTRNMRDTSITLSIGSSDFAFLNLTELLNNAVLASAAHFLSVNTLHITLGCSLTPSEVDGLSMFASVTHLALRYVDDVPGRLLACSNLKDQGGIYPVSPTFPRLRKISYWGPLNFPHTEQTTYMNLYQFLLQRRQQGLAIQEIELVGPREFPRELLRLSSYFPELQLTCM